MKKLLVVLIVLVLLAGFVLAVSAGTGGGDGGGEGWNHVAQVECLHASASNSTGRHIERLVPGLKLIRGGSIECSPPLPIG